MMLRGLRPPFVFGYASWKWCGRVVTGRTVRGRSLVTLTRKGRLAAEVATEYEERWREEVGLGSERRHQ